MSLSKHFYSILATTTLFRESRPDEVTDLDGTQVPGWARHERRVLLEAVNEEREKRGLDPVTEEDVRRGELVGHPSYGPKLAEHCAALVDA